MKRKIISSVILIVILLIIFNTIKYSVKSYKFFDFNDFGLHGIFNEKFDNDIDITSSFSNKNDTLINLKYNNIGILYWSFSELKDIDISAVTKDINRKNKNFYFAPYNEQEINPILKIRYRLPIDLEEAVLNLAKGSEHSETFKYKNYTGFLLVTKKFGIGELGKKSKIIFDFRKYNKEVIVLIDQKKQDKKHYYLMMFYPLKDEKISKNLVLSLFH